MTISSQREIGAASVSISWNPSARRRRIFSERLIFAGAKTCTACNLSGKREEEQPLRSFALRKRPPAVADKLKFRPRFLQIKPTPTFCDRSSDAHRQRVIP